MIQHQIDVRAGRDGGQATLSTGYRPSVVLTADQGTRLRFFGSAIAARACFAW